MRPTQLDHKDARIHSTILKHHTRNNTTCCLRTQQVPANTPQNTNHTPAFHTPHTKQCRSSTHQDQPANHSTQPVGSQFLEQPGNTTHGCSTQPPHTQKNPGHGCVVLLRKEVIQPHLPVRLPCYDFVPIASPTFDHSLPQGVRPWASGVTDFHDVTGGVYKARERIHRSVADLRLLATPTSRSRVADYDPN
jgi:hypothetical protein